MRIPRRQRNRIGRLAVAAGTALATLGAMVVTAVPASAADQSAQSVFGWYTSGTVLPDDGHQLPGGFTIPAADRTGIVSMSASPTAVLAVRADGSVATWPIFGFPAAPAEVSGVRQVDAAQSYALAVKEDGSVIAWGDNSLQTVSVPADVRTGVTAVAAGEWFGYALKDGGVRAWGAYGPTVPAAAQSGVTAIDAGQYTVAAVKSDGTVVSWCPLSSANCDAPAGLGGVTQVSSGFGSFFARKTDGTVVAWGRESTDSIPLAARTGVVSVSASDNALRVAVKTDGTVVSWYGGSSSPLVVPAAVQGRATGAIAGNAFFLSWFTPASAPAVTQQPSNLTTTAGQTGTFTAVASGDPAPSVQWQRAAPGSDAFADIPGATGSTYTTSATAIGDSGSRYRAVFTNSAGTATSDPASLTVGSVPAFTGGNAPTGTLGGAYWISYSLTGTPAPTVSLTDGALPAGLSLSGSGVLSGTPTKAGVFPYTLTAANAFGSANSPQQVTINPATTGQAANIAAPASVQAGDLESDTTARIFLEKANQTLAGPLTVGGTTIPAGTKVNSYYLHADPIGNANIAHAFAGTVNFGSKVLAVGTTSGDLQATTAQFGLAGTTYSTSTDQGLEYNDTTTVANQNQLTFSLNVYNSSDAIRIITLAP